MLLLQELSKNYFFRHLNYKFIVNEIVKNSDSDLDKVLDISKWLNNNIQKIPKGVEVIDSHPLTIVDRRLGTKDQTTMNLDDAIKELKREIQNNPKM